MRRIDIPELLDSDAGTAQEVADSLADLRWFNRYFGGSRTTTSLLLRVAEAAALKRLRYLDIAGGSGDNVAFAANEFHTRGISFSPTVLDRAVSHLQVNGVGSAVAGDALALPFAGQSFDVVGSSLFLHHLTPEEVVACLRESLRVAKYAVIVNDLERASMHWFLAWAGQPFYRSRITRHDAVASVRRAYTAGELRELAKQAGAARIEVSKHYLYRIGMVLWRT